MKKDTNAAGYSGPVVVFENLGAGIYILKFDFTSDFKKDLKDIIIKAINDKDMINMDSKEDSPRFISINPILNVADVQKSISFYTMVLGFAIDWVYGEKEGKLEGAEVSRGPISIKLVGGDQGNGGAWFYLHVTRIDQLNEEWKNRGAKIIVPPTDRPWGLREMLVEDPDGNIIRVGESTGKQWIDEAKPRDYSYPKSES